MVTSASLKSYSQKDLAQLAKRRGVPGWSGMSKDQLVKAITKLASKTKAAAPAKRAPAKPAKAVKLSKSKPSKPAKAAKVMKTSKSKPAAKAAAPKVVAKGKSPVKPAAKVVTPARAADKGRPTVVTSAARRKAAPPAKKMAAPPKPPVPTDPAKLKLIQENFAEHERRMDLARMSSHSKAKNGSTKDRVVLMVRDSYWLHCTWELQRHSVDRAKAALAEQWHTAHPCLRVYEVETGNTTSTAERVVQDLKIHGGVRNWYVAVSNPPKSYRVDIGYKASNGRFYSLAKSNVASTPSPSTADFVDENWANVAEDCERIYSLSGGYQAESGGELQEMFEERLNRPMGAPPASKFGLGAERLLGRHRDFKFEVDAEMIVFGNTKPGSYVTLGGEPVKVRDDGTFSVRLGLPDRRQVLPLVASSGDGMEQRTTVISVERNTKVMEPMIRDQNQ